MIERKVTIEIKFHANVPEDQDEAEVFADAIGEKIVDVLCGFFGSGSGVAWQNKLADGRVAFESFEFLDWHEENLD